MKISGSSSGLLGLYLTALLNYSTVHSADLDQLMQAIVERNRGLVLRLLRQLEQNGGTVNHSTCQDSVDASSLLGGLNQVLGTPDRALHKGNRYRTVRTTPLQLAAGFSTPEIVELLIKFGANTNYADRYRAGNTPLQFACRHGRLENAKVLLAAGADPNRCSFLGWGTSFPIHEAVKSGDINTVTLILDTSKVAVNAVNCYRWTPLHFACSWPDVFRLLLCRGADVNAVDQDGLTVLHESVNSGEPAVLAMIMGSRDFDWKSIHHRIKHSSLIGVGFGSFYSQFARSKYRLLIGDSLLHTIARNPIIHLETAIILLANGLSPHLVNDVGETAATVAKRKGNIALYELLAMAMIADRDSETDYSPLLTSQSFSLQLWSAHAIRRDTTLWSFAATLLPQHMVAFVFGVNWNLFRKTNNLW